MRKNIFLFIFILVICGLGVYFFIKDNGKPIQQETNIPEIINFAEIGHIKLEPGSLLFVYEKPGSPALSVTLQLTEKSICSIANAKPIICLAMSQTLDAATKGKAVTVTGIRTGDSVEVRTIDFYSKVIEQFGYIKKVEKNGVNLLVTIDEVDFLSGEKAIQAGIQDTTCTRETIADCIPSMNNDFYIRNLSTTTAIYNMTADSQISTFKNPGSPVLKKVDLDTFFTEYNNPKNLLPKTPFLFVLDGQTISRLETQYTP